MRAREVDRGAKGLAAKPDSMLDPQDRHGRTEQPLTSYPLCMGWGCVYYPTTSIHTHNKYNGDYLCVYVPRIALAIENAIGDQFRASTLKVSLTAWFT